MIGRMFGCDESFSGPLVFVWDAAFNSIIAARVNPELAASNLRLLMEQLESNGCLRQFRVGDKLNNLVGLPIVSLAVWKLYEATREKGYLKEFYEPLRRFNTWLETNRDKNGDGLLEWGYEENGRNMELKGRYAPWYESGIDDSPMWEGEPVDENLRCFAASAICLNSVYALDCMILADMAQVLEREDEKATYLGKHAAMASRVNSTLWDERRKLYANRRWSGEFSEEISPTSFYPLLARIPDHGRASALIAHLHDEREFGGEFMLPSIWRRSRHFTADGDYWRGRIWPPMSYLVMEGLKNYDPVSYSVLREKSLRMFRQEWIDHGHIHENYRSDTGYGETRGKYYRSSPFYTWGGLLALQA